MTLKSQCGNEHITPNGNDENIKVKITSAERRVEKKKRKLCNFSFVSYLARCCHRCDEIMTCHLQNANDDLSHF